VAPIERKIYATVIIEKVSGLNPEAKRNMELKIIQTGDKIKMEIMYLFLRFFLLAINTGKDDAIYKVIRNAANKKTVVIMLPGVTVINSVGIPKKRQNPLS